MPNINGRNKWNGPLGNIYRKRQAEVMKKARPWLKSSRNKYNNSVSKYNAIKNFKYTDVYRMLGGEFQNYKVLIDTLKEALLDAMTIYQLQQKESITDNDMKKVENLCDEYM